MNPSRIRLVCFDLGGVVVRICRSWSEGCTVAGIEPNGVDPLELPCFWELNLLHQTGRISRAEYARRLSQELNGTCAAHDIEAVHEAWVRGEYEGVAKVIDAINSAGLETAALSNTNAEHWEQMADYEAMGRIRHRHASHLLGLAKPDLAIYRAFEKQVGFEGPEILFFDDLEANVTAAREVGWIAERIDHAGSPARQIAEAVRRHGVNLQ